MKKLLFAIITGLLLSCTNPTEPAAIAPEPPPNPNGKITTLMFSFHASAGIRYVVLFSKSAPDTVVPVYENLNVSYQKVDSIWNYVQIDSVRWQVRVDDGQISHGNVYGTIQWDTFIKMWRE